MKYGFMILLLSFSFNASALDKVNFLDDSYEMIQKFTKLTEKQALDKMENFRKKIFNLKLEPKHPDYLAWSSMMLVLDRADFKQSRYLVCRDLEQKVKDSFQISLNQKQYPDFTWPALNLVEAFCD